MSEFLDLFTSEKKKKGFNKVKIQQFLTVSTDDEKRKIETSGEEGEYLIKIEVTDTRDLRGVDTGVYWKRVSKKAYFLLAPKKSDADQELYGNMMSFLQDVAKKLLKTPGVRQTVTQTNKRFG